MNILGSNLNSAYSKAYSMACDKLKGKDPELIAADTGVTFHKDQKSFDLEFMTRLYHISADVGIVTDSNGVVIDDTVLTTLLLHYLVTGDGRKSADKHIAFSEIPGGGAIYDNSYQKRVVIPLIKTFGDNPDRLLSVAEQFNGKKNSFGDLSVTFDLFPYVPVTYVIWKGDEEFPPSATIMFDESISSYLPVEDIVIMVSFSTYSLIKAAKK